MKTNSKKNTPVQALSTLHESPSLRAVTGLLLRPGGFHLTARGVSACRFPRFARIVDVGCGTGASVAYLREKHQFNALGFDSSEDLLIERGEIGSFPFALARAEELPLFHGTCDGILCECVLSLVSEPKRALAEFARVLCPGGYVIMSDLYDRCRGEAVTTCPEEGMSSALRSRSVIESLVENAGFTCLVWEDHTKYLKELAAQLILNHGFQADFCGFFTSSGSGRSGSLAGMTFLRPGYFLLVAQKK